MASFYNYFSSKGPSRILPNGWDGIALVLILGLIGWLAWGAKQFNAPYQLGQTLPISLDPHYLPGYALLTVLRMLIAILFSFLFTFIFGTWAAKSRHAERLLIPCIDILQSLPVLAMLTITITGFIALFPGSRLGPECAAIFAIFTAQVWNMTLSFYQSLRTLPTELKEAADMFHLGAWQRFWRIEVPFAMPGLLWNAMLSMSGSWLFLTISESMTVANQSIALPGVGSYLGLAIAQQDLRGVGYAIITMFVVIVLYDQLLFRPLLQWSEKFKAEYTAQEKSGRALVMLLLQRTRLFQKIGAGLTWLFNALIILRIFKGKPNNHPVILKPAVTKGFSILYYLLLLIGVIIAALNLGHFIYENFTHQELLQVFILGCYTALRVLVIVLISTLLWVPIGVWIGLRPRIAEFVQPIAQFLAAFPMNMLYPIVVIAILKFDLNVNIWTTPLMLLGVQWYVLFNVIAGASALPKDLRQVADNLGVTGWQWWRRLILPGIFPYYITAAITAAGNAWNTSMAVEVVSWGKVTLTATGLAAYITHFSNQGDFIRVALGMGMMGLFVLVMNRLVWRPLYNLAQTRYQLEGG